MRTCLNCGSDKTFLQYGKWAKWYKHDNNWYCTNCNNNLFKNHKRMWFRNEVMILDYNPRSGKCSQCGKEGLTHIHHIQYHQDNLLKDTIELCPTCHISKKDPLSRRRSLCG